MAIIEVSWFGSGNPQPDHVAFLTTKISLTVQLLTTQLVTTFAKPWSAQRHAVSMAAHVDEDNEEMRHAACDGVVWRVSTHSGMGPV